ncbi:MAG: helix-turn-helix domain-containing protein [Mycobacterium sp.]
MDLRLVDDVQALVDQLADRIRQSVAVDDPSGHLLAVSRHFGDADPYRMRLMLDRRIPAGHREYFAGFTRDAGDEPIRVPANARLSVAARVCFPIKHDGDIVAFLWVMELQHPIPEDVVRRYCARLANLLISRRQLPSAEPNTDINALAQRLLAGQKAESPPKDFSSGPSEFVVVAHYNSTTDSATGDSGSADVERIIRSAARNAADVGISLACTTRREGCTVAAYQIAGEVNADRHEAAAWLVDEVRRLAGPAELGAGFGVSPPKALRTLRRNFARAALSAFIGAHLYRNQAVLSWGQVRPVSAGLLAPHDGGETCSTALQAAFLDADGFAFDTVGAVLGSGRGVNAAELLHVHRTTLHYRLAQITEASGLDLAVPADRFLVFTTWLRVALMRSPIGALVVDSGLN